MNICISSYTFNNAFENRRLTALAFPAFCQREFGVSRIEFFDPNFFAVDAQDCPSNILGLTPAHPHIQQVKQACDDAGVSIVAISAQNDFTDPDKENRAKDRERVERWIEVAPALGAKFIRINAGNWLFSKEAPGAALLEESLQVLAPKAKAKGVVLAIENHPTNLESPEQTQQILSIAVRLAEQNVATCPDNGHIKPGVWLECLDLLFVAAQHCHVKFYAFDDHGHETSLRYEKFFEITRRYNYQGSLSIEVVRPVEVSDSFMWSVIRDDTLTILIRNGVPADVVDRLSRLKGRVFKNHPELLRTLSDILSPQQTTKYTQLIVTHTGKLDPDFESQKDLTRKAVQLLSTYGASR